LQIHIRLHGILREKLPPEAKGKTTLDLPDGSSVQDILAHFEIQRRVGVAVNQEVEVASDHPLKPGDHVEVFRVAAGG
jgi:sulfur carrier protein ThiS